MVLLDGETLLKIAGFLTGSGVIAGMVKLVYSCGKVMADINYLKTTTDRDIKKDLQTIRKELNEASSEISDIKSKVEILWQDRTSNGNSPRVLNRRGREILSQTGIREIIEKRIIDITRNVRSQKPKNAYEAERAIQRAVSKLTAEPRIKSVVEVAAFQTSSTVDEVSFVGALHVRNKILKTLNIPTKSAGA